jgi:hypothetical protein
MSSVFSVVPSKTAASQNPCLSLFVRGCPLQQHRSQADSNDESHRLAGEPFQRHFQTASSTMNSLERCGIGAILLLWQSWSHQEQQPTFTPPRYVAIAIRKPQRKKHLRRPSQVDGPAPRPAPLVPPLDLLIVGCAICTRRSTEDAQAYVSPESSSSGNNGGCPGPRIRSICTS